MFSRITRLASNTSTLRRVGALGLSLAAVGYSQCEPKCALDPTKFSQFDILSVKPANRKGRERTNYLS